MTVGEFLSGLERVKKSGTGWTARCPAHEDRVASLSVAEGHDGRVLVKCHAGCTTESIVLARGFEMSDLFVRDDRPGKPGKPDIVASYDYVDGSGKLCFQVVRKADKQFPQRRPDGNGGWVWNLEGVGRVLYRLPTVFAEAKAGGTVFVVEGEKDVHAMEQLGFVATCNPGGAGKWRDAYAESLRGASRVVVIPDCDVPGRAHAAQIAHSVAFVVGDVRVLDLDSQRENGYDVSHFIKDAGFAEWARIQLEEMVERAPAAAPGEVGSTAEPFARSLDDFIANKSEVPPALLGDDVNTVLPTYGLLIMAGRGGEGKTTLTVDAALHMASGVEWLGMNVPRPLRLLFIENEGPQELFRRKVQARRAAWTHEIKGAIFIHTADWGGFSLKDPEATETLRNFIVTESIDLVIGDPLDMLGMQGVGSPEETRGFVELMKEVGLNRDVAFWLLHHPRKSSAQNGVQNPLDEISGAWGGRPDVALSLGSLDGNRARLAFSKLRWGLRRSALILAFDPDTENFTVVAEDAEDDERDYVTEIMALLEDGQWRTAREIGSPRKPTKAGQRPGIGVNRDTVTAVLKEHPEAFISCTGEAAMQLGAKRRDTVLWQVASASKPLEPLGAAEGTGDWSGPSGPSPYRDHSDAKPVHSGELTSGSDHQASSGTTSVRDPERSSFQ